MQINSKIKNYTVSQSDDYHFIHEIKKEPHAFFVVDRNVYLLYNSLFSDIPFLFLLDAVEENKTMETVLKIAEQLMKLPVKRNIHLVSVGGGITQDITGFLAHILYRGVRWTSIPTTLLSCCDSCIGGKTAVNFMYCKNMLGAIYPADNVWINPHFLQTLSEQDYLSGLGEVLKSSIISGIEEISNFKKNIISLLARDQKTLVESINTSLQLKKRYIEKDEFDKGVRMTLNYGHTFAHALETVTQYKIPHGTAVAIGICAANNVSYNRGLLSHTLNNCINKLVKKIVKIDFSEIDLPIDHLIEIMKKDKKQTDDHLSLILLQEENGLTFNIHHNILKKEIADAVQFVIQYLK